jgi:phosphoglucan, water dikinase
VSTDNSASTQARLPSFSESFTTSVPLTRIRDIAHRNDIPRDVKGEIKHTLQNKLHRNAGPEDLVAAEAMLARITAPGADFSGAFVNEFKMFMHELRDFFNAGSLNQILEAVAPSMDDAGGSVVARFLDAKGGLEGKGAGADMNDVVDCMHQLTSVRGLKRTRVHATLQVAAVVAGNAV